MPGVQVGVGYIDIKPDMSGFSRELKTRVGQDMAGAGDQAGKKFGSSFTASVKGVAAGIGGAFLASKAIGFIGDAIGMASNLAESVNKSNQVFGESGLLISGWAKDAAQNIGLSEQAALEATGTFGNMFAQLGIGTQQAAQLSTGVVELAADMASFHNADIADVILAQSAAFRGEYDSLQRYLPLINAASVEQRALQLTGKKTTGELTAQDKALAVHRLMIEGAGDATGDFARTSDGLANQQRILNAEWANTKTELGQNLLPIMTSVAGFLNDQIVPAFKTLFSTGGDATGWAATLRDVIGDMMGFLLGIVQQTLRLMANLADKIPFGWAAGAAKDLRAAADAADATRESMHASKAELLEWAGATRNADLAAKLLTATTKGAAGAVDDQSKAVAAAAKATRTAAAADRDLRHAKKDLADLIKQGAVDEEKVADARKSLADATRSAAHADRDLADAQKEYDVALANANDLHGFDTAQETLADAANNLADAQESSVSAHEDAKDAAVALAKAQAGDPEFQDKLADARDKVADAQDKVAAAEAKTVAGTPGFVQAVGSRAEAVKLLNDQLGITETHLGVLNDKGNILNGLVPGVVLPPPGGAAAPAAAMNPNTALPSGMFGVPNVSIATPTTTVQVDMTVLGPAPDPGLLGKAIAWAL